MSFSFKIYFFALLALFAHSVQCNPINLEKIKITIKALVASHFCHVALFKKVPDEKNLLAWLNKNKLDSHFDEREKRIIIYVALEVSKEICCYFALCDSHRESAFEKIEDLIIEHEARLNRAGYGAAEVPANLAGLADFGLFDGDFYEEFDREVDYDYEEANCDSLDGAKEETPLAVKQKGTTKNSYKKVRYNRRRGHNHKKKLCRKKRLQAQIKAHLLSEGSDHAEGKEGVLMGIFKALLNRLASA